jgi:hypothetical protein
MLACHLDPELRARLDRLLARPEREPEDWPVPVSRDDLRRLMLGAGMCGPSVEGDQPNWTSTIGAP